jgi:hypothetical protein
MAISFVQGKGANNGAVGTSIAVTLTAAVGNGNFIAGMVSYNSLHTLAGISDDKGNTYNVESVAFDTVNSQKGNAFSLGNITNAPSTITATFTDPTQARSIVVDEFSGVAQIGDPRDTGHGGQVLPNSTGTGANAVTSGNFPTSFAGSLLYGVEANELGDDGATTVTAGTTSNASFTLTGTDSGSSSNTCAQIKSEWAVQSAPSNTTAATFTQSVATGRTVFLISALLTTTPPSTGVIGFGYNEM